MKRIVVLSDLQMPLHDKRAVENVLEFIRDFKPDEVASVGDEMDFTQLGRWVRGLDGEYKGDLQEHIDGGVAFFEKLRSVHSGAIHISRSNHMDRPLLYIEKHAPGLSGLQALTVPSLLQFDRLNIRFHEQPYELAPNWLLMHGDEGGLSREPGKTALRLTQSTGTSVICGHTHRLGLQHAHGAVNGKVRQERFGFEVGNLMDARKADYLKGGIHNWQQGFGILYINGRDVTPVPVIVKDRGRFVADGRQYG